MSKQKVYRHDALCPKRGSNWVKKASDSHGKRTYKHNHCGRKHQEGAKHRFIDEQKAQAAKMRAEGMILFATARVVGASVPTVSKWVKKGALMAESLTRFLSWRTNGRRSGVRASIAAFDEMWTYLGVRRGEWRKCLWIWTAAVEEMDGVRWRMYEVGDR